MTPQLRILFLEPFYGGSHRDVADGIVAHSRHCIHLITLPDRFWKWRLRGAALYWAERIQAPQCYDGMLVSSLMNLADLKAIWGPLCPPALVYFHENQFNYPLAPGEVMDFQFGFTNIVTALTADRVLFNSEYHRQSFFQALPDFLKMMPDYRPNWVKTKIAQKARVVYPGCHFTPDIRPQAAHKAHPPLIIWNHRWEHDKNPEDFFKALVGMQARGLDFEVALLGEAYDRKPEIFEKAPAILGRRLVHCGFVPARETYYQWLRRGTIIISTAWQENFGIAVVEAMAHGCLPLLPRRLSYPEILPSAFHPDFLYHNQSDLEDKLANLLIRYAKYRDSCQNLRQAMTRFTWKKAIALFDQELAQIGGSCSS